MNSDHLPLSAVFSREKQLDAELEAATAIYNHVIANRRPVIPAPVLSDLTGAQNSVFSWAEQHSLVQGELVSRVVQATRLPILPLSAVHPTVPACMTARRLRARLGGRVTSPLPWLPVDMVGPFLVVGHFNPWAKDTGGFPESVLCKVLLTRADYDRQLSNLKISEALAPADWDVAGETREQLDLPIKAAAGGSEEQWLELIWRAGLHEDADTLDQLSKEEALNRLRSDRSIAHSIDLRMADVRRLPTTALAPNLNSYDLIPRKVSSSLPALCYYVTGDTRHVLLSDVAGQEGPLQDELNQQSDQFVTVAGAQADEAEIRRLIEMLQGSEVLNFSGSSELTTYDKDRTLELDPAYLAELREQDINKLLQDEDQAPTVVGYFLYKLIIKKASDLHIQPTDEGCLLRERSHGYMRDLATLPIEVLPRMIAAVKTLSRLDCAERRLPQDGGFQVKLGKGRADIRVSTMPVRGLESCVMRIQVHTGEPITLERMQFTDAGREILMEALTSPNGIIAVTGPTGSGKTTTLDAALKFLNRPGVSITTLEDPVEIPQNRVKQVQINHNIGLNFAKALKHTLRHDPDIIMQGEVRTADEAFQMVEASNTGHLVLTTMHTNSAPAFVQRLRGLGIPPDQIASQLILAVAQRLIRILCSCAFRRPLKAAEVLVFTRAQDEVLEEDRASLTAPEYLMELRGCTHCAGTGYVGMQAVMEFMPVNPELSQLISQDASQGDIVRCARRYGYTTVFEESLKLVRAGVTTIDEAMQNRRPYTWMKPRCSSAKRTA